MQTISYTKDGCFTVTYKKTSGNNMTESHMHDSLEFYILLSGKRNLLVNDSFFEIAEGSLFSIEPQVSHRMLDAEGGGYEGLVCNLSLSWLRIAAGENALRELKQPLRVVCPEHKDEAKIRSFTEEIQKAVLNKNALTELHVSRAILGLLSVFLCYPNTAGEQTIRRESYARISELIRYINEHFDQKLALPELADRFFISEFHMCRLFKAYTGKTIGEYLLSVRIEKACKLLTESKEKIQNICFLCGFTSLSNFNKCFKTVCGKTPMQYRKGR